jgi:hypothetical protein
MIAPLHGQRTIQMAEIIVRENAHDARQAPRGLRIDRTDASVRKRASQERHMLRAGNVHIVDIDFRAAQKRFVLDSRN